MKWLFAILMALNIVVFGTIMAGKMLRIHQLAEPAKVASAADTALVAASEPAVPLISVDRPQAASAAGTKADSKKEAQKKAADTQEQAKTDDAGAANASCTATATLPEDDYHRLKGLLDRWPHAATEFVDTGATKKRRNRPTRYMVVIPNAGSEVASVLRGKGFDFAINQGQASLGVFARRSDAEALMARAKLSGFGDVEVTTLGGPDSDASDAAATSKMRVVFSQVSRQDVQDINRIIGRYGTVVRSKGCRS